MAERSVGRPRRTMVKRAIVRNVEGDEAPGVWISMLKNGVDYGVKDFGKLGPASTQRALLEFCRIALFLKQAFPSLLENSTQDELAEKLNASLARQEGTVIDLVARATADGGKAEFLKHAAADAEAYTTDGYARSGRTPRGKK